MPGAVAGIGLAWFQRIGWHGRISSLGLESQSESGAIASKRIGPQLVPPISPKKYEFKT